MSRKRNPVLVVLAYFADAELPLAEQALMLAQQIVRKRQPQAKAKARAKAKPAPVVDPPAAAGV